MFSGLDDGIEWVFDFSSIVGGFKFLREKSAQIMHQSTLINLNILESAREAWS